MRNTARHRRRARPVVRAARPLDTGKAAALALAAGTVLACEGQQSALDPAGPAAERIDDLWWIMFWIAAVVFLVVLAALGYALWHRRASTHDAPTATGDEWGAKWVFLGGVVIPAVILIILFVFNMRALGALDPRAAEPDLIVEVEGLRWWWRVRYLGAGVGDPGDDAIAANEIRIPVGRRVQIRLRSRDVIHSFWVPSLQGKMDLIPGKEIQTWIQADQPGTYRGQCAEYCGLQHANMAFYVVAMPPDEFDAWYSRQLAPASTEGDSLTMAGARAFLDGGCAICHTIRGTPAAGTTGPDLTHVGSRVSLAAGILPNTLGHLTGWIANPQQIKPGSFMPSLPLTPEQLQAIGHYLQSLR